MTGESQDPFQKEIHAAHQQKRSAIRAQFHHLYDASGCRFASIPRTGNFSFMANCIARWCPHRERRKQRPGSRSRVVAEFSGRKINEAINRLIDRRYIVQAPGSSLA